MARQYYQKKIHQKRNDSHQVHYAQALFSCSDKKTGNKRFRQHERKNRLGFVYCRFQQQTNKLTLIFDEIATLRLSPKGPYFFLSRFVFGLNKLSWVLCLWAELFCFSQSKIQRTLDKPYFKSLVKLSSVDWQTSSKWVLLLSPCTITLTVFRRCSSLDQWIKTLI